MSNSLKYKIIGDSCLDLTEELKKDPHFQMIPLTLQVDDVQVVDDETFDQKRFLELVKASPNCPKTACPSPETFKQAFTCDAEDIFVITLSSHLSGSYNSAMVGLQMYEEEYGHKNIHILDSWSASSGELRAALLIRELEEQGVPFEEIVKKLEEFKGADAYLFCAGDSGCSSEEWPSYRTSGIFCHYAEHQAGHGCR